MFFSLYNFPSGAGKRKMEKWFIWFASQAPNYLMLLTSSSLTGLVIGATVNIGALTDQHDSCPCNVCHLCDNKLSKVSHFFS